MDNQILLIRHCSATGQQPDCHLTEEGVAQSKLLARRLKKFPITRIVSSPWVRAQASVLPLSEQLQIVIETDEHLVERNLGLEGDPQWLSKLKESFRDECIAFGSGESSREATQRARIAVDAVMRGNQSMSVVVTHGNLLALILKSFGFQFGFVEWQRFSNPDVFLLTDSEGSYDLERVEVEGV